MRRADSEMKKQGVAVLDWLHALSPGGDKFGTGRSTFCALCWLCRFESARGNSALCVALSGHGPRDWPAAPYAQAPLDINECSRASTRASLIP